MCRVVAQSYPQHALLSKYIASNTHRSERIQVFYPHCSTCYLGTLSSAL